MNINTNSNKSLLKVGNLSFSDVEFILRSTEEQIGFEKRFGRFRLSKPLQGSSLVTVFSETSTRTLYSHVIAASNLGARWINMDANSTRMALGESLSDVIETAERFTKERCLFLIRSHTSWENQIPLNSTPIINGGGAYIEHPTQGLLDLFTVNHTTNGGLFSGQEITVSALAPNQLSHFRTLRSFVLLGKHFPNLNFNIIHNSVGYNPDNFPIEELGEDLSLRVKHHVIDPNNVHDLSKQFAKSNFLYSLPMFNKDHQHLNFNLKPEILSKFPNLKILHPFPRTIELPSIFDGSIHDSYSIMQNFAVPLRENIIRFVTDKFNFVLGSKHISKVLYSLVKRL